MHKLSKHFGFEFALLYHIGTLLIFTLSCHNPSLIHIRLLLGPMIFFFPQYLISHYLSNFFSSVFCFQILSIFLCSDMTLEAEGVLPHWYIVDKSLCESVYMISYACKCVHFHVHQKVKR